MVGKEPHPMGHGLMNPLPGDPNVLLPPHLPLPATQPLLLLGIINWDKHLLDAAHIRREILLEAPGHEGARGISPREEVVVAAGAVDERVRGHVVDGAVDGEVDGEGWVGAVVEGEFGGGKNEGTLLGVC